MKHRSILKIILYVVIVVACLGVIYLVEVRGWNKLSVKSGRSDTSTAEASASSVESAAASAATSASSGETASDSPAAQSSAVASTTPVNFQQANYSDLLMERNAKTWGIQNWFYNEDGSAQALNTKRITDILAAKGIRNPIGDLGEADKLPTVRQLLKMTYMIKEDTSVAEDQIGDETLTNWSQAARLEKSAPKLDQEASADGIVRCLYYIDHGKAELSNLEERLPFFYQGGGFWDGSTWRHFDWQHAKFKINGHELWEAGCGFVATAMAISYLSEKIVAPTDFMENGEYTGDGAAHTVGVNSAKQYGIAAHQTGSWDEVESALRKGLPVMVLESGPSMWAKTGHYIVLSGLTPEGKVTVYNPGGNPHMQYHAEDYGTYTPDQITTSVKQDAAYTIFGE